MILAFLLVAVAVQLAVRQKAPEERVAVVVGAHLRGPQLRVRLILAVAVAAAVAGGVEIKQAERQAARELSSYAMSTSRTRATRSPRTLPTR